MNFCDRCLKSGFFDKTCKKYKECPYKDVLNFNSGQKANVITNEYAEFVELVVYKDIFRVPDTCVVNADIDRSRKFIVERFNQKRV